MFYSFTYSIPYIIFTFILIILYNREICAINIGDKKKYTRIRYVTFLLLLLFFGLRGYLLTDWYSYKPEFDSLSLNLTYDNIFKNSWWDPGFIIYSIIIKFIYPDFHFWLFINTLTDLICLSIVFKRYNKSYVFSWIIFIGFYGLTSEINLFRNIKAIEIFLLALPYLEKRKFCKYTLMIILASLFHSSAVIYLFVYFFIEKKYNAKALIFIIFVSFIIPILKIDISKIIFDRFDSLSWTGMRVYDKIAEYYNNANTNPISLGMLERIFSCACVIKFYNSITKPIARISMNSLLLFVFFYNIFWNFHVLSDRISILFEFSYWIFFPYLIFNYMRNKRGKKIMFYIILSLTLIKVSSTTDYILAKYDNLLWGIESYNKRSIVFERDYLYNQ